MLGIELATIVSTAISGLFQSLCGLPVLATWGHPWIGNYGVKKVQHYSSRARSLVAWCSQFKTCPEGPVKGQLMDTVDRPIDIFYLAFMWFKLFSGYLNYISTIDLGTLINELRCHKHLSQIPLGKVMSFIQCASALKQDIMQPQPLSVPINHTPEFLLPSISKFLAESLELPDVYVSECWSIFKDEVWRCPSPEVSKKIEREAYDMHGKKWGLSE